MKTLKIANKEDYIPKGADNPHNIRAWLIGNEYGLLCVSYGSHESEALDNAVDAGFMDSELMNEEDLTEHEANGWEDSFIRLGNASEAFWAVHLWIKEH